MYEFFQNIWGSLQETGKESTTWFPVFLIYFSDLGFTLLVEPGGRERMSQRVHFQGLWDLTKRVTSALWKSQKLWHPVNGSLVQSTHRDSDLRL